MKNSLKIYITFILILFLGFSSIAQNTLSYKNASNIKGSNYYDIVKEKRNEINTLRKTKSLNRSDIKSIKHFERWAWFWKDRVGEDGSFPSGLEGWNNAGLLGRNSHSPKSDSKLRSGETWTNIGPTTTPNPNEMPAYPGLGRINAFWRYVDSGNSANNILIVGAPTGGIWKSTDNGATWSPKFDEFSGIGITDIKGSSSDINTAGVLYATTGDYDAGTVLNSIGVYKSTDKGDTWVATGLTYSLSNAKLLGDLVVFDAMTVVVGTKNSIKKTTDGGATWVDKYTNTNSENFGRMASSGTNIVCTDALAGVYASTDSGDTWTIITAPTPSDPGRSAVAADDQVPVTFYLQKEDGQTQTIDIVAGTATNVGIIPTSGGESHDAQGGYNQILLKRGGLLLSGSVSGFTSDDEGATWAVSLAGSYLPGDNGVFVHADHHKIGYLDAGLSFWNANDGGLNFINYADASDANPTTTYKSNGVQVTQSFAISIDPTVANSDNYLMANQDNHGYTKVDGSWYAVTAGDGVCSAIDHTTPGQRYMGGTSGQLTRSKVGNNGYKEDNYGEDCASVVGAAFSWPLRLSTATGMTPTPIYAGGDDLYKSTDKATTWVGLNAGVGQILSFDLQGNYIAVVGVDDTKKSSNDGSSWTFMTAPSGTTFNSFSIDAASTDGNTIYATVKGYNSTNKVFKTVDGGGTWANISGNLPNIVMKTILFQQNQPSSSETIFVGTELGVYYTTNGGTNWDKYGMNFPNVIVTDLKINYLTGSSVGGGHHTSGTRSGMAKLFAGTWGRGMWSVDIDINNTVLPIELLSIGAESEGKTVKIDWKTATELNNRGFEILHSLNGYNWRTIGFVEGSGTSYNINAYSYLHETPKGGINYYRLKQIDYDGSYSYSNTVSTIVDSENKEFVVFPNPVSGNSILNIELPYVDSYNVISIFNNLGQKVYQKLYFSDDRNCKVHLPNVPSGTYYLELKGESNVQVKRLIIN
ncbi:MAG: T9SS type A sorting domain-containing protein [Saprospiraceae bacterium]